MVLGYNSFIDTSCYIYLFASISTNMKAYRGLGGRVENEQLIDSKKESKTEQKKEVKKKSENNDFFIISDRKKQEKRKK